MIRKPVLWARCRKFIRDKFRLVLTTGSVALWAVLISLAASPDTAKAHSAPLEQYIPILCVTTGDKPAGMVIHLIVLFAKRDDSGGLDVHFLSGPGRLSPKAQTATTREISSTARAMGLSAETWSVGLSVPYPGLIIDGDSLSAMAGLAVVGRVRGEAVPRHHVISNTITSDGQIGPVSHMRLKIIATNQAGLHTVIVSSATSDGLAIPYPIHISHVGTVRQAYGALMAPRNLSADGPPYESDANQSRTHNRLAVHEGGPAHLIGDVLLLETAQVAAARSKLEDRPLPFGLEIALNALPA